MIYMSFKFRKGCLLFAVFSAALVFAALTSSCRTPEQYKEDADNEVYKIINEKWNDKFGIKANYEIVNTEPNYTIIKEMVPSSGVLSLRDAVAIATKYSRDYQNQKESLYQSALGLTLVRYNYARQWFGTVDVEYTRSFNPSTEQEDDVLAESSVGVSRTSIFSNGMRIGTSLAVDWARFLTGDPQTSLGSVLNATLEAPILGAGAGKTAWENLTQSERNVLYQVRNFNRYRQTFVTQIISAYYAVLQQRERVNISELSYNRLKDSTNRLNMEVEVGQRPQYDADEAKQNMLDAENNLVSDKRNYAQVLDSFKIRLSIPTDANITLDQNELKALEQIGVGILDFSEDEAIQIALEQRLDLFNIRDELDDASRQLALAAEGLGTQLNLNAGANATSDAPTDFTRIQFNEGNYSIGASADLPFNRKAERNAYARALIGFNQSQRSYDDAVENVKLDVRAAYRNLAETAESYRIQKLSLELALRRNDRERLMLEYGQGTVRLLMESEDAIVSAQNSVMNALIAHIISKMNFYRDIGLLQVKPDGMWEQKTNGNS